MLRGSNPPRAFTLPLHNQPVQVHEPVRHGPGVRIGELARKVLSVEPLEVIDMTLLDGHVRERTGNRKLPAVRNRGRIRQVPVDNVSLNVRLSFDRMTAPMEHPLTPKQKRVLECLRFHFRARGYMPSVRDIAKSTKSAISTIHDHLATLETKGWIRKDGSPRGITLIEDVIDRTNVVSIPVVGTITAGEPIEALEVPEDPVTLPKAAARPGAFGLRVRGDSMIDDHILDGDLVVVRPQATVANGEVAVALLDDGTATLKRVYRERGRIRLQPANLRMKPLYVKHAIIQGKVTAVLRFHHR